MSTLRDNYAINPNSVFVYGTLMEGGSHHQLFGGAGILRIEPASVAGELVDLGEYPALRIAAHASIKVHGQLITVENLEAVLSRLDEYEGPQFRREVVLATVEDGSAHAAWTYVLASEVGGGEIIALGRWRGVTMSDRVYDVQGVRVFECSPEGQPPQTARDATDIIGAARGAGATLVIVPATRLSDAFFQLRTGIAGEILQKFALYGVRLAIIGDISKHERASSAFRDLVYECNRGNDVWFLPDMASLASRLAPGA